VPTCNRLQYGLAALVAAWYGAAEQMNTARDFRLALKERGLRMTPQRQLILDAVAALHGHISADQVYQQVIRQFPDVNVTTVYRTLEVLEELGLMRHTHFHDGVAQYQRTDEAPHHHLVCTVCDGDTELDLEILEPLAKEIRRRYGFKSDLAHTAIVGVCHACQTNPEKRASGVALDE
jgi:Fur family ferric uptake transcriptional regulator